MTEDDMMDILEFLLTLLGIYILYHVVRFFIRFILPVIIGVRAMKKAQDRYFDRQKNGGYGVNDAYGRPSSPEGHVTVEKPAGEKPDGKIIKDDVGEDTPYEEVK